MRGVTVPPARAWPVSPQPFGLLGLSPALLAALACCGPSALSREDQRPLDSGDFYRYIMN
jgi:hypothetical protein